MALFYVYSPSSMDFEKVKIGIGYHGERPNITNPYVTRKVSKIIVHEGFNFKTLVSMDFLHKWLGFDKFYNAVLYSR